MNLWQIVQPEDRRQFGVVLCAAMLAPVRIARAQMQGKVYSLGVLHMGSEPVAAAPDPFKIELARLGFVEGINLRTHVRFAGGDPAHLAPLAAELIALKPDIILSASGTRGALAVKRQTTSVPIVFAMSNDPVGAGLVHSLAHPGENVTGSVAFGDSLDLKRLQILAQVMGPRASLAVLDGAMPEQRRVTLRQQFAASGAISAARLRLIEVARGDGLELAFEGMVRDGVQGVAINFSPLTAVNAVRIAELIAKHRLAAIGDGQAYVDGGVLLSYSTDLVEIDKRAAKYVAQILLGSKPGDLPVEHASKFVLVVNSKTARALGIKIPAWILASAEKVID